MTNIHGLFWQLLSQEVATMLVLGRKKNEKIVINHGTSEEITVTVVTADNGKVRLGFEAGGHIPIMREELLEDDHD